MSSKRLNSQKFAVSIFILLSSYEGGLQCVNIVEVWANEGLVVNASNGVALWNLRRLGSNRQLSIIVYAANARGRSEHVTFKVETALRLSPRSEPQEAWEVNWALGVFLGAALTVALILCLALIATSIRHRSRDYEVTLPTLKNQKVIVQKRNSPQVADDKNPDLIPLSKGVTEAPPDPPLYSAIVPPKSSSSAHSLQRTQTPVTPISSHAHYTDLQNDSSRSVINGAMRSHREIVTTRTPLLAAHQESCV